MNITQETYCSFEQAKALKELGFPQDKLYSKPCLILVNGVQMYDKFGELYNCGCDSDTSDYYSIPTQSQVQTWLRNNKNIIILVKDTTEIEQTTNCTNVKLKYFPCVINIPLTRTVETFDRYEDALSAGIDMVITHLKTIK